MECESELVAGLVTELSGAFFVIYSVLEITHLLVSTILFTGLCFGGLFVCLKSIIILAIGFLIPRVISFRVKITTAQTFIILFLFFVSFLVFLFFAVSKILCLVI
ncbi:NADH-ubiquinone oxidoreductase chain 1 [Trypanosoma theileri]|uniref:NADH-ubiquinone oxidoreductase chain 1 n=1 Tax=Trypanosoma theileri TaxID=67003 RepID=A0A1X0NF63_9TRYP|nr:NADH-ubiquinone oxidoreductase chain 1 [Trypanosoma theileri]ORC82517.1 NADH-ubiquinone oxidoreductase chain 1 [Trypanosoma theileri]